MSWGRQPKTNWAPPSASVILIPAPRVVQDEDYVTYWPQPGGTGERRARINQGKDKSEQCSGGARSAQRKPELGNLSEGWGGEGGREAETLASTLRAASGSY